MRSFRLGLTGSIGMGKSTTATMFVAAGCPVWDADAAVHRLYGPDGAAVSALRPHFPEAVRDGHVSRETLRHLLAEAPGRLRQLEQIVHPLVAEDRDAFLATEHSPIVVLDIPLLFENRLETLCDASLVVTAPADLQRARVMARPGMTEEQFALILSRQMADAEKRRRADHIVETLSLASTQAYVSALVEHILERRHA